ITGESEVAKEETRPEEADSRDLCRMLNTLFAVNLDNKERFKMLTDDFGIDIDENLREEVEVMCNLGQGLLEKGEKRGVKTTKEEDIINFYKVGGSLIMIAQAMSKTEEEIKKVLTDHGVNLDH
ncbi:MAG: hypothetical protein K2M91_13275, partial [Lachnospiraceae bacterium]|nr:hypothetical protein [Lachnospiraceae bacterium]